ncbi:hypothetical protein BJ878DRAFT_71033 [Calycina marina]|uniref:Uncharacterized protein n=1 Tax=Calycina marina TaxID=1763456 RepID=A0A9P8CIF6_9HELO|nr:hypothetical protein BJ878DRAFT_71033 [Calycina marina]
MYKAKADGVKDYTNYKYYEKYLDEPEEEGESRSQRNFFKDTLGNFQHKMKGIFSQAGKKRDFNVANHKHNARELLKKSEETNKWMAEQREKEEAKEKAHLQLRRRQFEFALREVNKICEAEEAAEAAALAEKAEEEAREKAERTAAEARAQYEDDGENQVNLALGSDNLYGAEPEIHQAEEYESQKARSSNSLSSFRTSYYANSEDLETLSKYYEQARLSETDVSRAEYGGGELPEGALRRHHSF